MISENRRYLVTDSVSDYRRHYFKTYKGARAEAHRILSAALPLVAISYSDDTPAPGKMPKWTELDRLKWDAKRNVAVPE